MLVNPAGGSQHAFEALVKASPSNTVWWWALWQRRDHVVFLWRKSGSLREKGYKKSSTATTDDSKNENLTRVIQVKRSNQVIRKEKTVKVCAVCSKTPPQHRCTAFQLLCCGYCLEECQRRTDKPTRPLAVNIHRQRAHQKRREL